MTDNPNRDGLKATRMCAGEYLVMLVVAAFIGFAMAGGGL